MGTWTILGRIVSVEQEMAGIVLGDRVALQTSRIPPSAPACNYLMLSYGPTCELDLTGREIFPCKRYANEVSVLGAIMAFVVPHDLSVMIAMLRVQQSKLISHVLECWQSVRLILKKVSQLLPPRNTSQLHYAGCRPLLASLCANRRA